MQIITHDVVYDQWDIGECYISLLLYNEITSKCTCLVSWEKHTHMITSKWFRFIIAKIYNILRYVIDHKLRHMCNLYIKETEISQKRSKGIKNWKITYSVILSVLSNKTSLILGFSSPLIFHSSIVYWIRVDNEDEIFLWSLSILFDYSCRFSRFFLADVGVNQTYEVTKFWALLSKWSIKKNDVKSTSDNISRLVFLFSCPQNPSINHLNFYCIKQIDYIFPCVCVL